MEADETISIGLDNIRPEPPPPRRLRSAAIAFISVFVLVLAALWLLRRRAHEIAATSWLPDSVAVTTFARSIWENTIASAQYWRSGLGAASAALAQSVWVTTAAIVFLACVGVLAFRRGTRKGRAGFVWRGVLVAVGALLTWTMIGPAMLLEHVARPSIEVTEQATIAAARRAFETRAAELTARAQGQSLTLACLDVVGNATLEAACEKAIFANPEIVVAAVAYTEDRISLLADNTRLLSSNRSQEPSLERLRRAIEADPFGLVAHVLKMRGCDGAGCAELELFRDPRRVLLNLNENTFDANVAVHSTAWNQPETPAASVASTPVPPTSPRATVTASTTAGTGTSSPKAKLDFPAASTWIPPVTIMKSDASANPESAAAATLRKLAGPARRSMAREATQPPLPMTPAVPDERSTQASDLRDSQRAPSATE